MTATAVPTTPLPTPIPTSIPGAPVMGAARVTEPGARGTPSTNGGAPHPAKAGPGGAIVLSGAPLDLDKIAAIAAGAPVLVDPAGAARVATGRRDFLQVLAAGQAIYGATTGVGAQKDTEHHGIDMLRFARALPHAHDVAVGEALPDPVARLTVALRLNTALTGMAGISVEGLAFLALMLDHDLLPVLRRRGSVGCGDLGQMGALARMMTGAGDARLCGQTLPADEALARVGMAPHPMPPRDALALVAVNSFGLAQAALATRRAGRVLRRAMAGATLGAQAMGANRAVWEGALRTALPDERRAAGWLLAASAATPDAAWPRPARVHDPLSPRMLVQVFGAAITAMTELAGAVRAETGRSDDNPVTLDGRVVTSGGSLLLSLSLRLSSVQMVLAHLARNVLNRCLLLTSGALEGLPVNLVREGGSATGFGPMMKLVAEQAVRAVAATQPVSLLAPTLAAGLEDEATMLPLTAERVNEQLDALDWLLTVEAVLSAQALDLQSRPAGGVAGRLYQIVRDHMAVLDEDVPHSAPLMALATALTDETTDLSLIAACPLDGFDADLGLTPRAAQDGVSQQESNQ